ncbi:hypothetical protein CPJCM30710_30850 [Clostridium polyendosporum]|uniref:LysM domain-containing protein n=1 Tax=Clostridium polyendosporum TaxID=69208 RepID=A0A919VFL0_9CLOT|nr:N-acetylmuramoyl-L-alanine amidase [Clostridium polyendosporum]GIM30419.1 hypothetical protein CPJCM30710_30850 [Clostridium polyendosporum]
MNKISTIAIDIGHNVQFDGGALGIKSENVLNFEVGTKLIEKCRAVGINVINCTPKSAVSLYDSLNKRVEAANNRNADFFISIHHNACAGGHGTEILCIPGGKAEEVANIILPEIVKLGFSNRGVKPRNDLFVLNKTNMSAILIECAFCDSKRDMQNYDTEKVAEAIFQGLYKAFNISKTTEVYHIVAPGDTLWALTRKYGTTINNIVTLNNIKNINLICPGQKLRMK